VTATSPRADTRPRRRGVLPALLLTCLAGAAVALVGWLLLLFVKGAVVVIAYALGIAMIVLPLLLARRLLRGQPRPEKRERLVTIATVVLLGAVLCVAAHLVGEHGWLLVVIPVVAVAVLRAGSALGARRSARRPLSADR
jgi:amino acid transporter